MNECVRKFNVENGARVPSSPRGLGAYPPPTPGIFETYINPEYYFFFMVHVNVLLLRLF